MTAVFVSDWFWGCFGRTELLAHCTPLCGFCTERRWRGLLKPIFVVAQWFLPLSVNDNRFCFWLFLQLLSLNWASRQLSTIEQTMQIHWASLSKVWQHFAAIVQKGGTDGFQESVFVFVQSVLLLYNNFFCFCFRLVCGLLLQNWACRKLYRIVQGMQGVFLDCPWVPACNRK